MCVCQEREENERLRNESISTLAANNEAISQNKLLIAELQEKQKQNELRGQQLQYEIKNYQMSAHAKIDPFFMHGIHTWKKNL